MAPARPPMFYIFQNASGHAGNPFLERLRKGITAMPADVPSRLAEGVSAGRKCSPVDGVRERVAHCNARHRPARHVSGVKNLSRSTIIRRAQRRAHPHRAHPHLRTTLTGHPRPRLSRTWRARTSREEASRSASYTCVKRYPSSSEVPSLHSRTASFQAPLAAACACRRRVWRGRGGRVGAHRRGAMSGSLQNRPLGSENEETVLALTSTFKILCGGAGDEAAAAAVYTKPCLQV